MKKILKIIISPVLFFLEWLLVPKHSTHKVRDAFETLFVALFLAMVIRSYVIQAFFIPSGSMETTLLQGDHLIANKTKFIFTKPKRHDILIFQYPVDKPYPPMKDDMSASFNLSENRTPKDFVKLAGGIYWDKKGSNIFNKFHYYMPRDFIKRCIGLPGDVIEIREKIVYINGEREVFDKYRHTDTYFNLIRDYFGPAKIPGKDVSYDLSKTNIYELYLLQNYFEVYNDNLTYDYEVIINGRVRNNFSVRPGQNINFQNLDTFDLIIRLQELTIKYSYEVDFNFFNFKLNGKSINEITLDEDTYFALGDNRDNSSDSRFWGVIPESFVNGTALFNYWPPNRIKIIK
jgi:signal peptidase I